MPPLVAHERVFRFLRNTPRGVRTGADNLCRRDNLMGQYGRAALSVARTPQTFSYRKRIRKGKLPPSAFRLPPSKREASDRRGRRSLQCCFSRHTNLTIYTGKRFCGAFPQKAGFLPSFFTQKSGTAYIKKQHHSTHRINGPPFTPVPTLHKKRNNSHK